MNDEMYDIYICEGNVCDVVGSLIMRVNFTALLENEIKNG